MIMSTNSLKLRNEQEGASAFARELQNGDVGRSAVRVAHLTRPSPSLSASLIMTAQSQSDGPLWSAY